MTTIAVPAHDQRHLTLREVLTDSRVMAVRQLRKTLRKPVYIVFAFIQPVMFLLLFRYVFGGATDTGDVEYIDFVLPGIMVQAAVFGALTTGIGLSEDLKSGVIDRFRSLPIARSAVLIGRTAADVVQNLATLVVMVAGRPGGRLPSDRARARARTRAPAHARLLLRVLVGERLHRARRARRRDRAVRRHGVGHPADLRVIGVRSRRLDARSGRSDGRGQPDDPRRRRSPGPHHRRRRGAGAPFLGTLDVVRRPPGGCSCPSPCGRSAVRRATPETRHAGGPTNSA